MASANHNVIGDPRMDDKEGVGTVNAKAAYDCVDNGWYWFGYKYENNLPFFIEFDVNAGQTVRFVIAWYAHTDYSGSNYYGNGLCADLNLDIYKGWGWYGMPNSYDSAWEIVQFTAPSIGTYRAMVSATDRGAGDPWTYPYGEYIYAAWYCW